jgi:hypothetical protein
MRRAARVDDNQPEIVAALRYTGASVLHLHQVGSGCPDILAGLSRKCQGCGLEGNYNYLIEIKDGAKSPSRQRLKPDEQEFFDSWRGQVEIARSIDEALRIVGKLPAI